MYPGLRCRTSFTKESFDSGGRGVEDWGEGWDVPKANRRSVRVSGRSSCYSPNLSLPATRGRAAGRVPRRPSNQLEANLRQAKGGETGNRNTQALGWRQE